MFPITRFLFLSHSKKILEKIAIKGIRNIALLAYHGEKQNKKIKGINIEIARKNLDLSSFCFIEKINPVIDDTRNGQPQADFNEPNINNKG